jgi:hypothetical protein
MIMQSRLAFALVAALVLSAAALRAEDAPFSLSIVPLFRSKDSATIRVGDGQKSPFHVVLTNRTKTGHFVFERSNSWGFDAISFDMILPDGSKTRLAMRMQVFTVNAPSTYWIPPGGSQVYPIAFDRDWSGLPEIPRSEALPVRLKAIYQIKDSPEARKQGVWMGSVESAEISAKLVRWEAD